MDRITRYLKKTKTGQIPRHIIAVDTETNIKVINEMRKEHTLKLGYAMYSKLFKDEYQLRKEILFFNHNDFFNFLDNISHAKCRINIFAHNASFDYHILKMEKYFSDRNFTVINWNITKSFFVHARNEETKKTITFSDTMNYFKTSLENLGHFLRFEKLKKPDFQNVSEKELITYCKRDTEIVLKAVLTFIDFIKSNDLGNLKVTIASQALTSFCHRFLNDKILIHTFDDILNMEINSYRGGRTEAFYLGKLDNIFYVDVNSLYPFVMKEYEYPIKPLVEKPITGITIKELEQILPEKYILAEVKVNIKEPFIAIKRDKLIFPIGKFKTTLTSPELEYLINNSNGSSIEKIYKVVSYDKAKIFNDYIDFFYNLKSNADNDIIREITKIFLNSLYGKFGQRKYDEIIINNDNPDLITIKQIMKDLNQRCLRYGLDEYHLFGNDLYKTIKCEGLGINSCPIISSTVTANARLYLWKLINIANKENVFYCDTDSLFINKEGFDNLRENKLIDQKQIGKLKLEKTGNVDIKGAKFYTFNNEEKIKGIKKNAIKINDTKYLQDHFETKKRNYLNEAGKILQVTIEKNLKLDYTKGIVNKNGEISPFDLREK